MKKQVKLLRLIRRQGLFSLFEARELLGADFFNWLADHLGVNVEIVSFGWGDYGIPYLKFKTLTIGGP